MKKYKIHFLLKNYNILNDYLSNDGKIYSQRETLLSKKQHRLITKSIKFARILKLLPFTQNIKVFSYYDEIK